LSNPAESYMLHAAPAELQQMRNFHFLILIISERLLNSKLIF
jgi:hypothetical protein